MIRLRAKGIYLVEANYPYRIFQKRQLHPAKFYHDSTVITLRLRLEKLWNGIWIPESLLPKNQDIPDGIVEFNSGKKIYVELENSIKGKARFLARLNRFREPILTLYVVTRPEIETALMGFLKSAQDPPPIGLLRLESVLAGEPCAWSPARTVHPFNQKEY